MYLGSWAAGVVQNVQLHIITLKLGPLGPPRATGRCLFLAICLRSRCLAMSVGETCLLSLASWSRVLGITTQECSVRQASMDSERSAIVCTQPDMHAVHLMTWHQGSACSKKTFSNPHDPHADPLAQGMLVQMIHLLLCKNGWRRLVIKCLGLFS